MANKEIRDYEDYTGADNEGYLIVGGKEGVTGGKKLLSSIGGGGYTKVTIDATNMYTDDTVGEYNITIPSNNIYAVITGIGEGHSTYNVNFTAPTIGNDEVLDSVIEFKLKNNDGNGHNINVTNLEYVTEDDTGGKTYISENNITQIIMLGSCWCIKSSGGDS